VVLLAASLVAGCEPYSPPTADEASIKVDGSLDYSNFQLPVPEHVFSGLTNPDRRPEEVDGSVEVPGFSEPPPGSGYDRYFRQKITWGPCAYGSSNMECATVLAPLDWFNPDGRAITLAMKRRPAEVSPLTDPDSPDLFINPGGPGGSAQDYVESFNAYGLHGFNIVGLDPRGSGESTPVVCGTDIQVDDYYNLNAAPADEAGRQALIEGVGTFTHLCSQNSGILLDHISTIEAVYDFDMVRQLLRDKKFNWLGVSYGTYIGAVYLELYPDKVGRMVLDAAVNIEDPLTAEDVPRQAEGFEQALHKYAKWAAKHGYGKSEESIIKRITDYLIRLEKRPLAVGGRMLTQAQFLTGLALFMYIGESAYETLARALSATMDDNTGTTMLAAADALNGRTDAGYDPLASAFPAISCKDWAGAGLKQSFEDWQEVAKKAPVFGYFSGPEIVCEIWSVDSAVQIDFRGLGVPPILVIGGTGDNATPYQYAQSMAKILPSAILVTRDGVGHGSYSSGSSCIDKIVLDFLNDGKTPDDGIVCQMD